MPPPPPPLYHHPAAVQTPHVVEEYSDRDNHGLGLADLFDISLTGIAFLSFGMFILQVLMCITMVSLLCILVFNFKLALVHGFALNLTGTY